MSTRTTSVIPVCQDLFWRVRYCAVPLGLVLAVAFMRVISHLDDNFVSVYFEPLLALQRTGVGRVVRLPLRNWNATTHLVRLTFTTNWRRPGLGWSVPGRRSRVRTDAADRLPRG